MYPIKHTFILLFTLIIIYSCSEDKKFVQYSDKVSEGSTDSTIIIIGDTQQTSFWEFWRESHSEFIPVILNKISDENPAMIIHLGDLVFNGASTNHWNEFNEFAAPIFNKQVPVYPVLGNHEYFGNNEEALQNYFYHFPSASNKQWYVKKYKSVSFIFLNSNFTEMTKSEIYDQINWLDLTAAELNDDDSIEQIIFVSHIPPYTNSKVVDDDKFVQNYFVSVFNTTKKASLFLSGHSHSYEHFIKEGKHYLVSGGGGGPRHELETNLNKKDYHFDFYPGEKIRELHYCKLTIHNSNLEIEMIQLDKETGEWSSGDCFYIP
jgi:Icc-related predicted phosphoesterase